MAEIRERGRIMKARTLLLKPVSRRCDLHCAYCFYTRDTASRAVPDGGVMPETVLETIFRKALTEDVSDVAVVFQGGEPTLRGLDFFARAMEMEAAANPGNIRITNTIQTNGTLIDTQWCRFLKKHGFLVGLSIDGTEQIHNTYRRFPHGGGSYSDAERCAELLDEFDIPYNILSVVTEEMTGHAAEIYHHYRQHGWQWIQFIPWIPPFGGTAEHFLTPGGYGRFLTELFDLWYRDLLLDSEPYIRPFDGWIQAMLRLQPDTCEQRGVCSLQYAVEADGSVYPCDFYMGDSDCLGNLLSDSLVQIDERRVKTGFLNAGGQPSEKCRQCAYGFLCRGGCRRYRETGNGLNSYCEAYRDFFAHSMEKLEAASRMIMQRMILNFN